METKDCKLVLIPQNHAPLKAGDYVEYICYSLNRTTDRAIGKVKELRNEFYVLGNHEMYKLQDLKPKLLYVVSDEEIKKGDSYIDLGDPYDYYGEVAIAGENVDLHVINNLRNEFKKVIATPEMIGFSKDLRHDDKSCHLCVPIETYELNDIMENKANCKIELKDGVVKLVENKITFVLN